jgi:beclin
VARLPDLPDMSFIEISKSQVVGSERSAASMKSGQTLDENAQQTSKNKSNATGQSMNDKVLKNERLFSILSSHSDIDHPICTDCTSLLLQSFTARLAAATRERDAYAGFLRHLQQTSSKGSNDDMDVAKELEELERQDEQAYNELLELEAEKAALEEELVDLEEESRQFELEEQAFWALRNASEQELRELDTELASLQQRYTHDQQQLDKLQRTNVYNDTFCIGHDGLFATINGLRLGRLPGQNVEWAEINAAWGQTLLLLATVAERLGHTFKGYRLRPLGSTSRIEKLEYPQQAPNTEQAEPTATGARNKGPQPKVTILELFSSGETAIGRMFNHRKFDGGMVAFLECLAQLNEHVERTSGEPDGRGAQTTTRSPHKTTASKPALPYRIKDDKIGDISIKLGVGFQQDESFTKACKYVLTDCKFLLAYCSNLENRKG